MDKPMMVISFEPTGEVNAMHRDEFPLGFLGRQEISRASEIIFDDKSQKWGIYVSTNGLPDPLPLTRAGTPDFQFILYDGAHDIDGYNTARDIEVRWLEEVALAGISVHTEASINILKSIRKERGV